MPVALGPATIRWPRCLAKRRHGVHLGHSESVPKTTRERLALVPRGPAVVGLLPWDFLSRPWLLGPSTTGETRPGKQAEGTEWLEAGAAQAVALPGRHPLLRPKVLAEGSSVGAPSRGGGSARGGHPRSECEGRGASPQDTGQNPSRWGGR